MADGIAIASEREAPVKIAPPVDKALLPELIALWKESLESQFFWDREWTRASSIVRLAVIHHAGFADYEAFEQRNGGPSLDRNVGRSLIQRAIRSASDQDFQKAIIRHALVSEGADSIIARTMATRVHAQVMAFLRDARVVDVKRESRREVREWQERGGAAPALRRLQNTADQGGHRFARAWAALPASALQILNSVIAKETGFDSTAFWKRSPLQMISGQLVPDPGAIKPHLEAALALAALPREKSTDDDSLRDKAVREIFRAYLATGKQLTISRDGDDEVGALKFLRDIEAAYSEDFSGFGLGKSKLYDIASKARCE